MMETLVQMLMSVARMSIIALTKRIVRIPTVDLIVNAELGSVEMDINAQVNMNVANCYSHCLWEVLLAMFCSFACLSY